MKNDRNFRSESEWQSPSYEGVIVEFCPNKGYGYIRPKDVPNELIAAHILC